MLLQNMQPANVLRSQTEQALRDLPARASFVWNAAVCIRCDRKYNARVLTWMQLDSKLAAVLMAELQLASPDTDVLHVGRPTSDILIRLSGVGQCIVYHGCTVVLKSLMLRQEFKGLHNFADPGT